MDDGVQGAGSDPVEESGVMDGIVGINGGHDLGGWRWRLKRMCWLVGHLESWSMFCCRRRFSQEGHFGTREVSIGCVREARRGLGSAALTIFLQMTLVAMA